MWNELADPVSDGVGLASFQSRVNVFFIFLAGSYSFGLLLFSLYILLLHGFKKNNNNTTTASHEVHIAAAIDTPGVEYSNNITLENNISI